MLRDAFKKGGKGLFQKPNFFITLVWDILGRREGVKTLIPDFQDSFIEKFPSKRCLFFSIFLIFYIQNLFQSINLYFLVLMVKHGKQE